MRSPAPGLKVLRALSLFGTVPPFVCPALFFLSKSIRLIVMQKVFPILCALTLLCAPGPRSGWARLVDRNVVAVNGDTITLSEINEMAKPFFDKVRAESKPEELALAMSKARRMVVERLIARRLVAQEAAKYGITVTDEELEQTLEQLRARRGDSREAFLAELKEMGVNESQYQEEVRDQMLSSKVISATVRSRILVTDAQILERYRAEQRGERPDLRPRGPKYHLRQIGVAWDRPNKSGVTLTREEARKKIEQIRSDALSGKDFAELARTHSDLPTAEDGGSLGELAVEDMAEAVRNVVASLGGPGVSEAVEMDGHLVIFKLGAPLEKAEAGATTGEAGAEAADAADMPSAEEKERIRQELTRELTAQRLDEWLRDLRRKAYIQFF